LATVETGEDVHPLDLALKGFGRLIHSDLRLVRRSAPRKTLGFDALICLIRFSNERKRSWRIP
jgi:hypothetical protein